MSQQPDRPGRRNAPQRLPAAGIAPVFAALGDETRLHIIERLCTGRPMSITELTEGSDITRQAITKHLTVLAESGLVTDKKVGRERQWQCEPARLDDARRSLEHIARQWDQALAKLKAHVEE